MFTSGLGTQVKQQVPNGVSAIYRGFSLPWPHGETVRSHIQSDRVLTTQTTSRFDFKTPVAKCFFPHWFHKISVIHRETTSLYVRYLHLYSFKKKNNFFSLTSAHNKTNKNIQHLFPQNKNRKETSGNKTKPTKTSGNKINETYRQSYRIC